MIDKNILIVDDDDNMREAMKETVLRLGVSVDTAENGRIGFEKATKKVYDLIISDMRMPEIDGLSMFEMLKATGIKTGLYNGLIALLTAVVTVVGMRLMGALLISGLIIFPSLSAMRICKSYKGVTLFSVLISVLCFITGLTVTFYLPVPTGACIVVINLMAFIACAVIGKLKETVSVKSKNS